MTEPKETALALHTVVAVSPYEPRDYDQAMKMAATVGKAAGLTPEVAYLKMSAGWEYGIGAIAALRLIDVINVGGSIQVAPRAQLLMGVCLRAKTIVEYFEFVSGDATQATYRTRRFGGKEVIEQYTIEQAKKAGLIKPGGNWEKDAPSMLIARATSRLARKAHPDICGGMYTADELRESDGDPSKVTLIAGPVTPLAPAVVESTATPAPRTDAEEIAHWTEQFNAATSAAAGDALAVKIKAAHPEVNAVRVAMREVRAARVKAKWAPVPTVAHDPETGEVQPEREAGSDG